MTTKYFDRSCKEISFDRWTELQKDKSYCIVHEFENDRFSLKIKWSGKVDNVNNLFRSSYPLFVTEFLQYDNELDEWLTSVDSGQTFSKESKAYDYYEDFALTYTDSYIDEGGYIISKDNLAEKPKPITPSAVPVGDYNEMVW